MLRGRCNHEHEVSTMIDGLRVLTLGCHLMAVNLASCGPLLCVWLDWRGAHCRRSSRDSGGHGVEILERTTQRLATASLIGLLVGMLLGAANAGWLYAAHRSDYLAAATRLRTRFEWGGAELLFSILLLALYRVWFRANSRYQGWQRWCHPLLAVTAATNLLYHFPPLFSVLAELATHNEREVLSSVEFRSWLVRPQIVAKTAHVWGASLSVAGIALSYLVSSRLWIKEGGEELCISIRAWGARWCLLGTIAQIPTGLWLLSQLSPIQQHAALGTDPWATAFLSVSVMATFLGMNWMAQAALGRPTHRDVVRILLLVSAIILLMTATLVRLYQSSAPVPSTDTHAGQYH